MLDLNAWDILALLAVISLVISFLSKSKAIWAGLLFGIIMAAIAEIFSLVFAKGFYWPIAEQMLAVSVLAGFLFDVVYRFIKRVHKS